jgi:hypothetical protein
MTRLAELAIRLFQNRDYVSGLAFDPDAYDWDDHYVTIRESVDLSGDDKNLLLGFCLDLAVHFARTAEVALGPGFSNKVVADWSGRGWETRTERSGTVRPTSAAVPGCSVADPWSSTAIMPSDEDPIGLSAVDRETLWRSLLSDEPAEELPLEFGQECPGPVAEVISIEALRQRRASRRKEPWIEG